ncbi:class I SAM-dependent methyltransferase [Microbulbifer sp. Q7]|uniref:class I SAM-dependent methyltransferase n=1 Tax=Microbulbifer sp. Q7 TaxID=1785091 RepID=UPI000834EE1C|nr:methyltransferase [Microbulbifer sp. Q7]
MQTLLSQILSSSDSDTLWVADENSKPLLEAGLSFTGQLISNRWDITHKALAQGFRAHFCDFDLSVAGSQYSRIVYPVSKEKAAVHYIINQAPAALRDKGELLLLGNKSSGIKTYAQKAAQRFGAEKQLQKHSNDYLSITRSAEPAAGIPLDDSDYPQLRQPEALAGLYSKPGLFGWNKVDTGSALLARHFGDHVEEAEEIRAVDLGCGYGYLSSQLADLLGKSTRLFIEATDNNAAALLACERNFLERGITGRVVPGDAGSEIEGSSADILICNPPFHQGFQVEGDLTDRFLSQAARILRAGRTALFVVNEFIPLGKKAQGLFQQAQLLEKTKGFCIYRLTK